MNWSIASILVSLSAFGVAYYLYTWVRAQPSSNKEIARIGDYIRRGANAFLAREYKLLAVLVLVVAALIFLTLPNPIWQEEASVKTNLFTALSYVAGSIFSALAGKIGIFVATLANVKSAEAATKGIRPAFMAGIQRRCSYGHGCCWIESAWGYCCDAADPGSYLNAGFQLWSVFIGTLC